MKNLIKEQITQDEKNRILELHNILKKSELHKKNRKFLSEQIKPPVDEEEYMENLKNQCAVFKDTIVWNVPGENKAFLYKEDNKKYEYWYSIDGTYDITIVNKDGVRELVKENLKWYCKEATQQAYKDSPERQLQQNTEDSGLFTKDYLIKTLKRNWQEIEQNWEEDPKYKGYYRRKNSPLRTSGFDENQEAFIKTWTNTGDNQEKLNKNIYKINPTAADFATGQWNSKVYIIAPGSKDFFAGEGLKIYYNPSNITMPTKSFCKDIIKDFAKNYKLRNSRPADSVYIDSTRRMIQMCVDNYKFGGALSGVKDELNLLGGMVEGGARAGTPYYIKLERKL